MAEIQDAVNFAQQQPEPPLSNLYNGVYYEEPAQKANPESVLPSWIAETFGVQTPINPPVGERVITYPEALREAMAQAMERDERVTLLGEDIGIYGGAFGVTLGLIDRFGAERVRDTPISENNIAGTAIGAGMTGLRAVAEMQFMDFVTLAMEQIV